MIHDSLSHRTWSYQEKHSNDEFHFNFEHFEFNEECHV